MIKTVWYMLKVGVLIGLCVWIAQQPGTIAIDWGVYTVRFHVGFFLLLAFGVILLSIFFYSLITAIVEFPVSYCRYREIKNQEKGYKALTVGLTAVAAGDAHAAGKYARQVDKYMPDDTGLSMLLQAQAARLEGRADDAKICFAKLLENKDAAFLGVRGLLQAAMEMKKYDKALEVARYGLGLYPKQAWLLQVTYDLELRQQDWNTALATLRRCSRAGVFSKEELLSNNVAICIALAHSSKDKKAQLKALKNAYNLDYTSVAAAYELAKFYINAGQKTRARRIIEKTWKVSPHLDLSEIWALLEPSKAPLKWWEKLISINKSSCLGYFVAGNCAVKAKLWGEARVLFEKSIEVAPNIAVYKALAELEALEGRNQVSADLWFEKARALPPEKAWVCQETGRIYEHWEPVAQPHGSFNTITWAVPGALRTGRTSGNDGHELSVGPVAYLAE